MGSFTGIKVVESSLKFSRMIHPLYIYPSARRCHMDNSSQHHYADREPNWIPEELISETREEPEKPKLDSPNSGIGIEAIIYFVLLLALFAFWDEVRHREKEEEESVLKPTEDEALMITVEERKWLIHQLEVVADGIIIRATGRYNQQNPDKHVSRLSTEQLYELRPTVHMAWNKVHLETCAIVQRDEQLSLSELVACID